MGSLRDLLDGVYLTIKFLSGLDNLAKATLAQSTLLDEILFVPRG